MSASVKSVVDAVRLVAVEELDLPLPLAKARNAISMMLYGKPYSAAIAAENAGHVLVATLSPENAKLAADVYRVCEGDLIEAAEIVFEREAEADLTDHDDRDVLEGLRVVITGVERAIVQGTVSWASFLDTDDLLYQFGNDQLLTLDDACPKFNEILDAAIDSDGRSLVEDIQALLDRLDGVVKDLSWLEALNRRMAGLSLVPPQPRKLNRSALMLAVAPNLSSFTPDSLPRVDYTQVDFARLAQALADALFVPLEALRIADDVVDQLTIHHRQHLGADALRFEDVLEQVWEAGEQQVSRVLHVRPTLATIQGSLSRRDAPPPMGILFVLETTDYFVNSHLIMNARAALGITAGTLAEVQKVPGVELSDEGRLTTALKATLEELFGAPYYPEVALSRPVNKNRPARYRRVQTDAG